MVPLPTSGYTWQTPGRVCFRLQMHFLGSGSAQLRPLPCVASHLGRDEAQG